MKLFRISTVPISLNILLKGQLKYLNQFYEVTAISGAGKDLDEVREREEVKIHPLKIARPISPFQDVVSLWKLYRYFKKEYNSAQSPSNYNKGMREILSEQRNRRNHHEKDSCIAACADDARIAGRL